MARPQRNRKICTGPNILQFAPAGATQTVQLTVDEYEALRWVDFEKLTHKEAAQLMDVSRTTVTEIYESARNKVAECIVTGKGLSIEGGNYHICDGHPKYGCTRQCEKRLNHPLYKTYNGKESTL
ncbi:MAG: DUF134 domain-containing protein [Clostridiales bacterium]|nr:DUF134 domain-containing protein [Clostridiales bacterium]